MVSVHADVEAVQDALSETAASLRSVSRKALSVIARGTLRALKSAIRQTTARRTGGLLRAYRCKVSKDGLSASVYPKAAGGSSVFPKIFTLNYGYDGPEGRARNSPRAFIQSAERYAEDGGYMADVRKLVGAELEKHWRQ